MYYYVVNNRARHYTCQRLIMIYGSRSPGATCASPSIAVQYRIEYEDLAARYIADIIRQISTSPGPLYSPTLQ